MPFLGTDGDLVRWAVPTLALTIAEAFTVHISVHRDGLPPVSNTGLHPAVGKTAETSGGSQGAEVISFPGAVLARVHENLGC